MTPAEYADALLAGRVTPDARIHVYGSGNAKPRVSLPQRSSLLDMRPIELDDLNIERIEICPTPLVTPCACAWS